MSNYKVDLKDGRSIVILYIKDFEWFNKEDETLLKGHPYSGRVYRAVKSDGAYYIKIDGDSLEPDVLGIKIVGTQETTQNWSANVAEIDDDNIIDFQIEDTDYRKIGVWLETSHKDFVELIDAISKSPKIEFEVSGDNPDEAMKDAKEMVMNMIKGTMNNFDYRVSNKLSELIETDPMQVEAVDEYLGFLLEDLKAEDPDMISLSREIALHSKYGKGANLYNAINHLQQYLSPNSGSKQDLLKALQAISFELIRLKINGNNE